MQAWSNGFLGSLSRYYNGRLSLLRLPRRCMSTGARTIRRPSLPYSPYTSNRLVQHCRFYSEDVTLIRKDDPVASHELSQHASYSIANPVMKEKEELEMDVENPADWIARVDRCLPRHLQSVGSTPLPQDVPLKHRATVIAMILVEAKRQGGVDILTHLGLVQGRWRALLWITDVLIDLSEDGKKPFALRDGYSNIQWPVARTLQDFTAESFLFGMRVPAYAFNTPLLEMFTSDLSGAKLARAPPSSSQILGQIWSSLGSLLIAAAEKDFQESNVIVSNALLIIAALHHKGQVPSEVYRPPMENDIYAVGQPPLLHMLSARMLSSLSDTMYHSHYNEGDQSTIHLTADHQHDQAETNLKVADLGPELWFEFVLWCCLYKGFVLEGSHLLRNMRKSTKPNPWTLICWRDIMQDPDQKWEEFAQQRLTKSNKQGDASKSGSETNSRRSVVERTISSEVVVAYVDGLLSKVTASSGLAVTEHSLAQVLQAIFVLKGLLDRDGMSLGVSTWESVISRFAMLPELSVNNTPRTMESVLRLVETSGHERSASNVPSKMSQPAGELSFVFDESATMIGMYHRVLHSFIRVKDVGGALRVLSRLQSITDDNKKRALADFFQQLQSVDVPADGPLRGRSDAAPSGELRFKFDHRFSGAQFPSLHHQIPDYIMAELMDLITENGAYDVGKWLLHSKDIDGPWISSNQYGNQVLSPSLIRFAAATRDMTLLSAVTRSQTSFISGKTLVALCESRIRKGEWNGAFDILGLIRDHLLHAWTAYDMAIIVRALLFHLRPSSELPGHNTPGAKQASTMLQRLLRGDLGQVWGSNFSNLDTTVGVLSTVDPRLAKLCSNLLARGGYYTVDLRPLTFEVLLDGVVKAYGSTGGQELMELWCSAEAASRQVKLPDYDGKDEEADRRTPAEAFGIVKSPSEHRQGVTFNGFIIPRIQSVRIVVQQALREDRGRGALTLKGDSLQVQVEEREFERNPVLDWAVRFLRERFAMSDEDVDYELQGYFSAIEAPPAANHAYTASTLRIWRALGVSRRKWARSHERQMRQFAVSATERKLEFKAAPPAERNFLHCLAAEFGLVSESFGDAEERAVTVYKVFEDPRKKVSKAVRIPARTLSEAMGKPADEDIP